MTFRLLLPTIETRASLVYLVNAVMLFGGSAGLTLVLLLSFGHIRLSSADPFFAALGSLWVVAGLALVVPALVISVLWRHARHHAGHQWAHSDLRLGVILVALGLICGQAVFSLQYARAQAQVNTALTAQFLNALKQTGLQLVPEASGNLAFADHGRVMWAAGPSRCPQARVQWERLDARWEPHRSGGMMTAGMLEATLLRTLWFHGCLSDGDYLTARHALTLRAEKARARLRYEVLLPAWEMHWPLQSWASVRRPLYDRIRLDRETWCEEQQARAGWSPSTIAHRCEGLSHPKAEALAPSVNPSDLVGDP